MTSSVLYGYAFLPYLKATSYKKGSSTFHTFDLGAWSLVTTVKPHLLRMLFLALSWFSLA